MENHHVQSTIIRSKKRGPYKVGHLSGHLNPIFKLIDNNMYIYLSTSIYLTLCLSIHPSILYIYVNIYIYIYTPIVSSIWMNVVMVLGRFPSLEWWLWFGESSELSRNGGMITPMFRLLNFISCYTHMLHGAGIFTNIYPINDPNVGKYTIHWAYGIVNYFI